MYKMVRVVRAVEKATKWMTIVHCDVDKQGFSLKSKYLLTDSMRSECSAFKLLSQICAGIFLFYNVARINAKSTIEDIAGG